MVTYNQHLPLWQHLDVLRTCDSGNVQEAKPVVGNHPENDKHEAFKEQKVTQGITSD